MNRATRYLLFPVLLLGGAGCGQGGTDARAPGDSAAPDAAHATDSAAGLAAHEHTPSDALALLPIMQNLGSQMTSLTYALMTDDRAGVERSAVAIAQHVPISSTDLERIQAELTAWSSGLPTCSEGASRAMRSSVTGSGPPCVRSSRSRC